MLKKIYAVLDKKQRIEVVLLLVVILISSIFELLGVSAILPLIKAVTDPEMIESSSFFQWIMICLHLESGRELIAILSISLAGVYVIKNLYILWMNRVVYRFIYQNQAKLAGQMFECYVSQDLQFHYNHNVAELNRNVELDVTSLFYVVQCILQLITEILVCILLVAFLILTDFKTTMILVVLMILLAILFLFVFKQRLKYYGVKSREYSEEKSKWFLQTFNGIKEIKAIGREPYFINRYKSNYENYARVMQRQQELNCISKPVVEMICICGILIFMALRILTGADITQFVPVLSVFAVAAFRMMPSFNRISNYLNAIMFNKASVDGVYHNLKKIKGLSKQRDTEQKTISESTAFELKKEILLEELTYAYPNKPDVMVLNGINMRIPSRKSIALVGGSGAGKTTLADVILGLYQPKSGRVLVDGKDIFENPAGWRKMTGYIPQNIYLLDDTIRANIALGVPEEEVDDEKVWAVLEEAQLADFVRKQKDGLEMNIGDRGVKLSGGQRQRIGIARALYTDPELLVLDEATSALDNETERAVMDAIFHLSGKVTMVVIAHRITTIKDCDYIYRIADGKATEVSYSELTERN
ncbi:MAG: ABC transporter ATP-binding protein [Lachnospiraceae bacterium]|nr:ABC transporter ATP-binding protein [Lachnospiraceae bacterium]